MSKTTRMLVGAFVALLLVLGAATSASAEFRIESFDGAVSNQDGSAATQAGAHPFSATTVFRLSTTRFENGQRAPDGQIKDIEVDLPPGFVGNPQATPRCTAADFAELNCPVGSQVGLAYPEFLTGFTGTALVYNLVPPENRPAQFGFQVGNLIVYLDASVRTGSDYGLTLTARNISQSLPLGGTTIEFWGVPADPAHDDMRGSDAGGIFCAVQTPAGIPCSNSAGYSPRPLLTNPTQCNGPLPTTMRANAWSDLTWRSATFFTHQPPPNEATLVGPENCDRLPFDASLSAEPITPQAGTPSGYVFDLRIPQNDNWTGLAQAHLRKVVASLPAGLAVSPSSADGLGACAPAQIGIDNASKPTCPSSSQIGTVEIDTPLLEKPMTGQIYLAKPNDNPFNTLLSLYLVAEGSGVMVKLPGRIDANSVNGQLTATFDNNPQLPFDRLRLVFKDGPRAPLTNPQTCGTYTTNTQLTAWSGKVANSTSSFAINSGQNGAPCPQIGFKPSLEAGMANPAAGQNSTFNLTFGRSDSDQLLKDITVDMPQGLLARIADIPLCAEAQAAAGTCGEASRVGSTTTAAGTGSQPFYLPGRVYMGGPYKGAPFNLSIVVPAVAGPFDLGTVVVRAAVFVDRETAALRVVSDPLPTILQGIPLQIRSVNVRIDRERFMFNPSSCKPTSVGAVISSVANTLAGGRSRFQAGGCKSLPFRPKMRLRVGSRGHTGADRTTPLKVTLSMTPGQANNRSVKVTLPDTINARLPVINRACSLEAFKTGRCGPESSSGTAVAVTPLLRDPLRGPAYWVRNPARRLPDLMVALRGQVDVDLTGKVTIPQGRQLATTFDTVPDVPITKFTLSFVSGRQAPVGVVENLCRVSTRRLSIADLVFKSHSGRTVRVDQKLSIAGCGRGAARGRRGGRRAGRRGAGRARGRRGARR